MRFIHMSDIQLGLNLESGRRWEQERSIEIFETLENVIQKAEEISCELLLISGQLFSHEPVTTELEKVNRAFLSIPGTEIIIVSGRSDTIKRHSPIRSFSWAPNVHFEITGEPVRYSLDRLGATVYAISVYEGSGKGTRELADFIKEDKDDPKLIKLGLIWEPSEENALEAFDELDLSYIALGGKNSMSEVIKRKMSYSGGTEPKSMSDGGEHGILIGEISSASGRLLRLDFEPMASVTYMPLAVNVNKSTDNASLTELIRSEIEKRGSNNIYRLRLYGGREPDVSFELGEIERSYRIAEVIDETEPLYDHEKIFEEHPYDLLGYYIGRLGRDKREPSELERKAMIYGIDALLKTSKGAENKK